MFFIVEYLHISLGHLHTDIVLSFLKVGSCSLEYDYGKYGKCRQRAFLVMLIRL